MNSGAWDHMRSKKKFFINLSWGRHIHALVVDRCQSDGALAQGHLSSVQEVNWHLFSHLVTFSYRGRCWTWTGSTKSLQTEVLPLKGRSWSASMGTLVWFVWGVKGNQTDHRPVVALCLSLIWERACLTRWICQATKPNLHPAASLGLFAP